MARDHANELKVLDAELAKDSMKGLWAREERVEAIGVYREESR